MVEFLHSLASATPLPGGGAAATYSLGLALGLIEKVALLEIHRQADRPEIERNLITARNELQRLRQDVVGLIERDPDAYRRFATERSGGSDETASVNFSVLVEMSMLTIEKAMHALTWAGELGSLGSRRLRPHLLVAGELAMGAIRSSGHLARENIGQIISKAEKNRYLPQLAELQQTCQTRYDETMQQLTAH